MTTVAPTELTRDEARALTDEIRSRVVDLLPRIKEAYDRRADRALGYSSWHEYCTAELEGMRIPLADRPAIVAELRQTGMSTRAIGAALGVDAKTVRNDLGSTGEISPVETVRSLDGRERPATQPARPTPVAPTTTQMPTRQEAADAVTAGIDQHLARVAVEKAMDEFLPPDPDAPHREWRMNFLSAMGPTYRLMAGFAVSAVAERADEECLVELERLAREINTYCNQVRSARPIPNNVRHLRVAS